MIDGAVTANLAVGGSRGAVFFVFGSREHPHLGEAARIEKIGEMLTCRTSTRIVQPRNLFCSTHLGTDAVALLAVGLAHASRSQVVSATPRVRNSNFNTRIEV